MTKLPRPSALTLRPRINYGRERHRFGMNSRRRSDGIYGAGY